MNMLEKCLPKWPMMKVSGVPVSVEQALEIIRRTDTFFRYGGGNNHSFNESLRKRLGVPTEPRYNKSENWPQIYGQYDDERSQWCKSWGVIETQYVHNSWISCAFILGPHGWCHPDGTIGFVDNVGKWPKCEEVFDDWKILAKEFPFLDLGVTLMSGEECEDDIYPVISFAIKDGSVEVVDPARINVHENHTVPMRRSLNIEQRVSFVYELPNGEQGLSPFHLDIFIQKAQELGLAKKG